MGSVARGNLDVRKTEKGKRKKEEGIANRDTLQIFQPRDDEERAVFSDAVSMAMNSFDSRRKGSRSGWRDGSVVPMTRSQNRVSRNSLRQMKFLAMKSGLVCPAWPSSKFAPMEVPASSNWKLRCLTIGPRPSERGVERRAGSYSLFLPPFLFCLFSFFFFPFAFFLLPFASPSESQR